MDSARNNYIPKDYEDLYNAYFAPGKLAPVLCRKLLFGRQSQDWQDANQEAYLRLLNTQILEKFDSSRANFGGMVFLACRSACCNTGRRGAVELNHLSLVETNEERIPGAISGNQVPADEGQEDRIIAALTVEELRKSAREAKTKGKAKRFQNQEQLIDLLLEGRSREEIAGILKVSRASVDLWVSVLSEGTVGR